MAKRISKILLVAIALGAILFVLSPGKFIDTVRFFPHFNPMADPYKGMVGVQDLSTQLPQSELIKTSLPFGLSERRNLIVYLPKGYEENGSKRYPVLYLLHGSPGQETDWLQGGQAQSTLDSLIDQGKIKPLIVVFPDGNGGILRDTQYVNSPDGKQPNEDFIVRVVVNYVDSNFKTEADAQHRAIGGLSSGGFGALNLTLKHQDIFGFAVSMSGYGLIDINPLSEKVIQGSAAVIAQNSPQKYIKDLAETDAKILMITGEQDPLLPENEKLAGELKQKKFDAEVLTFSGQHNWKFWSGHLPDALEWLSGKLG
ncbi:MAG: alpha/beta hydrolase [Acidobacteriaceae bacterium]